MSYSVPKKVREQIRKRDGKWCQVCKMVLWGEVHHIHPRVYGGGEEMENLIGLCSPCHYFAPNTPEEFVSYKSSGGIKMIFFGVGYYFASKEKFNYKKYKQDEKKFIKMQRGIF